MAQDTRSPGGIDFFGLLQILFIGLKLTGYISWPWWLVLLPLILYGIFLIIYVILAITDSR